MTDGRTDGRSDGKIVISFYNMFCTVHASLFDSISVFVHLCSFLNQHVPEFGLIGGRFLNEKNIFGLHTTRFKRIILKTAPTTLR